MKIRTLVIGIGVLVALAGVLFAVNQIGGGETGGRIGRPLLDNIDLSAVTSIEITSEEGTVTMQQGDEGEWTVKEQGGFHADPAKIKGLLVRLNTELIAHRVTGKKEKFAGLNLLTAEENNGKWEKGKTGVLLLMLDKARQPVFGLITGRDRRSGFNSGVGGTYVRFAGETMAYLVKENVFRDYQPENWIAKEIFDEEADKVVQTIHIRKKGQPEVSFSREKPATKWVMKDVPEAKVDQKVVKSLAGLIAGMDLARVALSGDSMEKLGRAQTGVLEFSFFDKRAFTVEIGTEKAGDEYRYFTIRGELDASVSDEKLKTRIAEFNARYQGRILAIFDWDGSKFLQGRKDFLVKKK